MMNSVLKMMNFVLKMMIFALKMMNDQLLEICDGSSGALLARPSALASVIAQSIPNTMRLIGRFCTCLSSVS